MVRVAPLDDLTWTGDHEELIAKCASMAHEWAGALLTQMHCAPYRLELGEHADRNEVAVAVALPSRSVRVEASLMVPWINHRGPHSIAQLRAIRLKEPRHALQAVKYLVSCWLDVVLLPEKFEAAQQKLRPLPLDLAELPPNVVATPAASPPTQKTGGKNDKQAGAASSSTPGARAATRSMAERNLAVEPVDLTASPPPRQEQAPRQPIQHQPVSLAPVAPYSLPLPGASAPPEHPERPERPTSADTSVLTPRGSPDKSQAGSGASTPTRAGCSTRSQSRSPKPAGKDRPAKP
jgi:hypothetical protein